MKLRIALLQLLPGKTQQENRDIGIAAVREAAARGADIALFPEMWNIGYRIPESREEAEKEAVPADGAFVRCFRALAAELRIAVGITFLEKDGEELRNSIVLFDMEGREVYRYSKVHVCVFGDERILDPGEGFTVRPLMTRQGTVETGSMICYDREFPESARLLMLQGAELILTPNACPMEVNRLSQLRGRAFENMLAIATVNYPKGQPDCNGHSTLFDGVAYLEELPESRDTCVLDAGEASGVYIAELDMDMLRAYRKKEVHGDTYRRPPLYLRLTEGPDRILKAGTPEAEASARESASEEQVRADFRRFTMGMIERGKTVSTMESCTAGLIASLITDTEGASAILKGAFVTYSNEAKIREGVPAETIERYSVYSRETAAAMAEACRSAYRADIGIGVTGTTGNVDPANADASTPGQVYFAFSTEAGTKTYAISLEPEKDRCHYKLAVAAAIIRALLESVEM